MQEFPPPRSLLAPRVWQPGIYWVGFCYVDSLSVDRMHICVHVIFICNMKWTKVWTALRENLNKLHASFSPLNTFRDIISYGQTKLNSNTHNFHIYTLSWDPEMWHAFLYHSLYQPFTLTPEVQYKGVCCCCRNEGVWTSERLGNLSGVIAFSGIRTHISYI